MRIAAALLVSLVSTLAACDGTQSTEDAGGTALNQVNVGIGTALDTVFDGNDWSQLVALNVPAGSVGSNYQIPWTTETTLAVTAGDSYTVFLAARRELSSSQSANCNGSLKVEIEGDL
ncbi:MAG TPA: hypothetical protein VHE35_28995 [Kofleriaceae bacterium]|nr:hypothetical protein [Kofleriaceae bacterium]